MARKLRVKDEVVVIAGNDRGQSGKVLSISGDKIIVEGINVRKKHMKPQKQGEKGQIIDVERPINISNVMASVEGKGVRLRVRYDKSGEKELCYKQGKKTALYRPVKKLKK